MKAKEFYRKHKKVILGGAVVTIVIVSVLLLVKNKKTVVDLVGESVIHWKPTDASMPLETVKKVLDLNATNLSQYAIFREGSDPSKYVCLVLGGEGFVPAL